MVYELITVLLLVAICFLLYKLYKIKYTQGEEDRGLISDKWKSELMNLEDDEGKAVGMKLEDIDYKISELEKKIEKNENFIKKLVEQLS